jgi:cation transport ATPase
LVAKVHQLGCNLLAGRSKSPEPPETTTERTGPMDRFNALGRGAQIMLVACVLLLIDLFLPWQDVGVSEALGVDIDDSVSGWRGFAGVMLGLLTLVTLAWLIVRLLSVNIPLPVSTAMTGALLGVLVAAFGIIKLLTILGDYQTIWAWIGAVLAIAVAVGAYLQVQESGGVDTLRSEATAMSATRTTSTAATPPAAESPPPPPPQAPSEPQAAPPPPAEPEAAPPPVEPAPPAEPERPPAQDEERRDL